MVSKDASGLQDPLSFTLMQNEQFVFLQINLDKKEFNPEHAEPEVIVTPLDSLLAEATNGETGELTAVVGGRCIDFFAAPYMLKLCIN